MMFKYLALVVPPGIRSICQCVFTSIPLCYGRSIYQYRGRKKSSWRPMSKGCWKISEGLGLEYILLFQTLFCPDLWIRTQLSYLFSRIFLNSFKKTLSDTIIHDLVDQANPPSINYDVEGRGCKAHRMKY